MRERFVLYTSYREQLQLLTNEQKGILFDGILAYVSGDTLPDMDGVTRMAFSFIKKQIDADDEKYQKTIRARQEAGKMGGRPKANGFSEKQEKAKKANGFFEKQNNPVYVYDNDNVLKEISPKGDTKKKRETFEPPTVENVRVYCQEAGCNVDAERFVDFYASKDWMVGKNKMKDWKAAVRNWNRQKKNEPVKHYQSAVDKYNQGIMTRDVDMDALEKELLGGGP